MHAPIANMTSGMHQISSKSEYTYGSVRLTTQGTQPKYDAITEATKLGCDSNHKVRFVEIDIPEGTTGRNACNVYNICPRFLPLVTCVPT